MKGDSVDVAGRKLKEVHSQYQEKTKEFDRLYEAFTKTSQVGGGSGWSSGFLRSSVRWSLISHVLLRGRRSR